MEIIASPYVLSENWNKMHDIFVTMPGENFKNDVKSSLNHFKLKKVMAMMKENLKELRAARSKRCEGGTGKNTHRIGGCLWK